MMRDLFLTTNFLSCLRHFDYGIIFFAGVPCFALHRLPGNCRPFRTFFKTSELQKLRILRFLISEILNFYNSGAALGIAAASFAKLGLQTSDYGLRFFLSEEKIKASKDIAESPTA